MQFHTLLFSALISLLVTKSDHVNGHFKPQFSNLEAPKCLLSAGQFGKCYRYIECASNYPNRARFELCEYDRESRRYTVCCPKLSMKKFDLLAATDIWSSPSNFECGVRLTNPYMMDLLNAKGDPEGDDDLWLNYAKALTIKASISGTHPWMAAILYRDQLLCGASIIDRRTVLSSAHCFIGNREINGYTITIGSVYLGQGERHAVRRIRIHPNYRHPYPYNDIALITLDNELNFDWNINAVCIARAIMKDSMLYAQNATVIGFGNVKPRGPISGVLQEAKITVLNRDACRKIYETLPIFTHGFTDEFICAGEQGGGKDACSGDSGGPLTIEYYTKTLQIGIVSFGLGCGLAEVPGVYTSIAYHFRWIMDTIKSNEKLWRAE